MARTRLHELIDRRRALDLEIAKLLQQRPASAPMHAVEIAEHLGIAVETFYRRRQHYHLIDKMPQPIAQGGRPAWERSGMMAWLTRFHPARPQQAANDMAPLPDAACDDEHRARLAAAYGR